jgi:hypothetical protein
VARLRDLTLTKPPGIAEAIDWTVAMRTLGLPALDPAAAAATLGAVVKHADDHELVHAAGLAAVVGHDG